jgi:uncharacterized protein YjlB
LPLLFYPAAINLPEDKAIRAFERMFAGHGWVHKWYSTVYGYHHYHSTAHEVLGVCRGRARIQFGGDAGQVVEVQAGDAVLIPAGVAHKNLTVGTDMGCVGAYPAGQDWDMNYGRPDERPIADRNIQQVSRPHSDPVYGAQGPLAAHWPAR